MRLCTAARPRSRQYRPRMDRLEDRNCPAAPWISFVTVESGQQSFMVSGNVMDENPAGLTVQFSGAFGGTVTTNANGGFSVTIQPGALGALSASVTDGEGLTSDPFQTTLSSSAPVVTGFTAVRQFGNTWLFTGSVSDEYAPGLTVRLGGLPSLANRTATVQADGTFSISVTLAKAEEGTAWAKTTDWWGNESNEATWAVQPSA